MYLRFVIAEIDSRSQSLKGIFTVGYDLLRDRELEIYEEEEIKTLLAYFQKMLPIPTKFSRKKKKPDEDTRGISWIKSENTELVTKLYELKNIVERHGYFVETIKSKTPGYVVYEDEFQVVAEPFN